jgi:hypothetical protein
MLAIRKKETDKARTIRLGNYKVPRLSFKLDLELGVVLSEYIKLVDSLVQPLTQCNSSLGPNKESMHGPKLIEYHNSPIPNSLPTSNFF